MDDPNASSTQTRIKSAVLNLSLICFCSKKLCDRKNEHGQSTRPTWATTVPQRCLSCPRGPASRDLGQGTAQIGIETSTNMMRRAQKLEIRPRNEWLALADERSETYQIRSTFFRSFRFDGAIAI